MTIENDLTRIATALETIAVFVQQRILEEIDEEEIIKEELVHVPPQEVEVEKPKTPKSPAKKAVKKETPPEKKATPPKPPQRKIITVIDLNIALMKLVDEDVVSFEEVKRIMKKDFGVESASKLEPNQFNELLVAVKKS